jgi:hypothetical protein
MIAMPVRQAGDGFTDTPFDVRLHAAGTKGARQQCSWPYCTEPPTVSRHWDNPAYEDGWWAAYCSDHAPLERPG